MLASAGAPYCKKYVESHLTPAAAGKYFMAFAVPDGAKNLKKLVDLLPDGCKDWFSISRFASERTPTVGKMVEDHAASEAIRFADNLLADDDKQDVQALLRSLPTATPKPLSSVVQLVKRLQSTLKTNNEQDAAIDEVRLSPENSPPTFINWDRLLDDIEPYLYGSTPMCKALWSVQPLFQDQGYFSKVMVLVSDGNATVTPAEQSLLACSQTRPSRNHADSAAQTKSMRNGPARRASCST